MKGCRIPVLVTTIFLVVYTISPYIGVPEPVIALAYVLAPFLVIWMVFSILIKGEPSGRTFEDGYWYDDPAAPRSVGSGRIG
jgi:hypothetical protein